MSIDGLHGKPNSARLILYRNHYNEKGLLCWTEGIEERKKGKWMEENTRSASYIFKCSCCGKNAYFVHGKGRGRNCENRYCGYDYCPNCGADMRGEKDE